MNPDDSPIRVFKITPENREVLSRLVVQGYVGKACTICGHVLESVEDIVERQPVRSNTPPAEVDLACGACWTAQGSHAH